MKSGLYEKARSVVNDMDQIRVSISDPNYLLSLDVCYTGKGVGSDENTWGIRAAFYSSMYPETTEEMIREREPGS
jgi:hypothetical protein